MNNSLVLVALIAVIACVGCTERDGPAERLGEQIDDTLSDVQEQVEQFGEDALDRVDEALGDE